MKNSTQGWPRLLAAGLLGGSALILAACGAGKVEVAAVLPLTGEHTAYGESIKNGIELAADDLGSDSAIKPGVKLAKIYDSKSDPKIAAAKATEAYDDGALILIGGVTSAEAKAIIPITDKVQGLLLSPSASSPELTDMSPDFFRIWPSDQTEAAKMAQSAVADLGIQNLVVVAEDELYARGAQNAFRAEYEAKGGKVIQTIVYPAGTNDVSGQALEIIGLSPLPEAVYVVDYGKGVANMVKELRRHHFPGKILTTSAFATPSAIERCGPDAAGVLFTQTKFDPTSDSPQIKKFVDAYQQKYRTMPDIYAAHGYDALMTVAQAIQGREPVIGELTQGMMALSGYQGLSGVIGFDEKGDVKQLPNLYMIGEKLTPMIWSDAARAELQAIEQKNAAAAPPAAPATGG